MIQPITPDLLKRAAKRIRGLEQDRLGASLPHSTVLNALAQGLGLGPSFGAWKATVPDPAATARTGHFVIAFPAQNNVDVIDTGLDLSAMRRAVPEFDGYTVEKPAHGYQQLSCTFQVDIPAAPAALFARARPALERLLAVLATLEDDICIEGWPELLFLPATEGPDATLGANFRYHDNDQVCTADIDRNAWALRFEGRSIVAASGIFSGPPTEPSPEAFLLLLYQDIEIDCSVTENDITLEDVFESMQLFQES